MSQTPAAHLAKLRVVYGDRWRIDRTERRAGAPAYIACERSTGRRMVSADIADLEQRLEHAGRRHHREPPMPPAPFPGASRDPQGQIHHAHP